jgi:hypothetical protein
MIDPELASLADLFPAFDLSDIEVAREAFEQLLVTLRVEIPGIETLRIEDRLIPGAAAS